MLGCHRDLKNKPIKICNPKTRDFLGFSYVEIMKEMGFKFITFLIPIYFALEVRSQPDFGQMEAALKSQYGIERLVSLTVLADHFDDIDSKKCLKYARQAQQLSNNLLKSGLPISDEQWAHIVRAKEVFGQIQYKRGKYLIAREAFQEASSYASMRSGVSQVAAIYLNKIDSLGKAGKVKDNPFKSLMREIDIGAAINNSSNNVAVSLELQKAVSAEKAGDTATAIAQYEKAARLLGNTSSQRVVQVEEKLNNYRQLQELRNTMLGIPDYDTLGNDILSGADNFRLTPVQLKEIEELGNKAKASEAKGDYKAALNYYQQYLNLQVKMQQDSLVRQQLLQQTEQEMERLEQEKELADLNIKTIQLEKQSEEDQKNALIIITGLVVFAIAVILFFYLGRIKKHRALSKAYKALDQTKLELEGAEKRISRLLEQQVSPDIAQTLIEREPEIRRTVVTVMFLDIRNFTPKAEQMEPSALIAYQNCVFGFMIEIVNKYHGNINQFLGDGFMATFGAPKSYGNDAANAFRAAHEILQGLVSLNKENDIPQTEVGIGLNTGEVVAGNVGTDSRKQFSITGNTVIVAARLEQLNKQFGSSLILSDLTRRELDGDIKSDSYREEWVILKGRSEQERIFIYLDE